MQREPTHNLSSSQKAGSLDSRVFSEISFDMHIVLVICKFIVFYFSSAFYKVRRISIR